MDEINNIYALIFAAIPIVLGFVWKVYKDKQTALKHTKSINKLVEKKDKDNSNNENITNSLKEIQNSITNIDERITIVENNTKIPSQIIKVNLLISKKVNEFINDRNIQNTPIGILINFTSSLGHQANESLLSSNLDDIDIDNILTIIISGFDKTHTKTPLYSTQGMLIFKELTRAKVVIPAIKNFIVNFNIHRVSGAKNGKLFKTYKIEILQLIEKIIKGIFKYDKKWKETKKIYWAEIKD